jgi:cysteine-rich repeat protein
MDATHGAGGSALSSPRLGQTGAAVPSHVHPALAVALCFVLALVTAQAASAVTVTYTSTETIPVPPASNYAGAGGGDGWDVSLSPTEVFNVFHHSGSLSVACHKQSDASQCYPTRTITDDGGMGYSSASHSGTYLAQANGKLWVYATRNDGTAGVVCVDTTTAAVDSNPFCGFVALTAVGDGGITSVPMRVGNRLYAFNYFNGIPTGDRAKLLCFDTNTEAACAGQPLLVDIGAGAVSVGTFPVPATAVIGDQVLIPIYTGGTERLACWDDSLQDDCAGAFPLALALGYAGNNGSPFPLLDASGGVTGFCLPTSSDPCFTLAGASTATPANMTTAIGGTGNWNGAAVTLGPRVYLATGLSDTVRCYDYSTSAGCANFPHATSGAGFIYTVNPDPQRPTCIWVNADFGPSQIQNFDAFTGGACGQGAIRVLSSQLVVPQEKCDPAAYKKLEVLEPDRADYTDGTIAFANSSGNPIGSIPDQPIDGSGAVGLTGLGLEAFDSPQFLITLNTTSATPSEVVVRLTWEATFDPDCVGDDTETDPACGNGQVETGEECDDGNIESGDGCSAVCAIEAEGTCDAPPPICPPSDLSKAIFCVAGVPCRGTNGADVICGSSGNDRIYALGGDDVICAGSGNDLVQAGQGNDRVDGSIACDGGGGEVPDDDRIKGLGGADILRGGIGDDWISAGTGDDRVYGEDGDDRMQNVGGSSGADLLIGGPGDDTARGGRASNDICDAEHERGCELECQVDR